MNQCLLKRKPAALDESCLGRCSWPEQMQHVRRYLLWCGEPSERDHRSHRRERARLAAMLRKLEKEQQTIDLAYGADPASKSSSSHLPTSHSEASFESISYSDVLPIPASLIPGQKPSPANRRTASGNWVSSWFVGAPSEESSRPATGRSVSGQSVGGGKGWNAAKEVTDAIQGMSSSVDTGEGEMPDRRY